MSCKKCGDFTLKACKSCKNRYCGKECQALDHKGRGCYYYDNIEERTIENVEKGPIVLYNDPSGRIQVAIMSVNPGDDVPQEVHKDLTQFIRVEEGYGTVLIGDYFTQKIGPGDAVVIPAGTKHMIKASKEEALKFYTIYSKNASDEWEH